MTAQDVRQLHTHIRFLNPVAVINITLIALCAGAVLSYVLWSNSLAAGDYRITMLHGELSRLADANGSLATAKSSAEDPATLLKFAQAKGMVEAKNVSYVFESGNVALRQ